jgi:NodT family efflux transporter outer membrane factor (OMF) lipoprotein
MKNSMNYIQKLSTAGMSLGCLLLFACSVPKRTAAPQEHGIPQAFAKSADSSRSIAAMSRDTFFKDPLLQSLIRDVLAENPDMHIALQRIHTAGAYFKMRKGALLPSVQATATASGTKYGKYTMEGVGNYDTNLSQNIEDDQRVGTDPTPNFWLGLNASWEIDIWGKLRNLKKAARMRYLASVQARQLVASMLTAQTALLYYELVALDNEAAIIRNNVDAQEKALEIVTAQKEAGRATELAVQQLKAQMLNTQSVGYAIRQQIVEAENQMNVLLGRYDGTIARSATISLHDHFYGPVSAGVPAQLLQYRPDVLQAQSELAATHADLMAARAAFFPSLNLSAYTAFNAFKSNLLFAAGSLGSQVAGGLTAPIFQQHQLKAQFRIANAAQEEAFYNFRKTVLDAYKEVLNNLSALDNTRQMYQLKKQEVTALEQGVSISQDLYLTGYATYLEIVSAQKSKLEAQLQLVAMQRNEVNAMIALYKSLGGGS